MYVNISCISPPPPPPPPLPPPPQWQFSHATDDVQSEIPPGFFWRSLRDPWQIGSNRRCFGYLQRFLGTPSTDVSRFHDHLPHNWVKSQPKINLKRLGRWNHQPTELTSKLNKTKIRLYHKWLGLGFFKVPKKGPGTRETLDFSKMMNGNISELPFFKCSQLESRSTLMETIHLSHSNQWLTRANTNFEVRIGWFDSWKHCFERLWLVINLC